MSDVGGGEQGKGGSFTVRFNATRVVVTCLALLSTECETGMIENITFPSRNFWAVIKCFQELPVRNLLFHCTSCISRILSILQNLFLAVPEQ